MDKTKTFCLEGLCLFEYGAFWSVFHELLWEAFEKQILRYAQNDNPN